MTLTTLFWSVVLVLASAPERKWIRDGSATDVVQHPVLVLKLDLLQITFAPSPRSAVDPLYSSGTDPEQILNRYTKDQLCTTHIWHGSGTDVVQIWDRCGPNLNKSSCKITKNDLICK